MGYYVADCDVFDNWLCAQGDVRRLRPRLRTGESSRIVKYLADLSGVVLGSITPESIGIVVLDSGLGTDPFYRVIEDEKFVAFLTRYKLRKAAEPPALRLAIDGPRIHHEEYVIRDYEEHGFRLFPSTRSHSHQQYYKIVRSERFSFLLIG